VKDAEKMDRVGSGDQHEKNVNEQRSEQVDGRSK